MTTVSDWDRNIPAEQRTWSYFVRGMHTLWRLTASEHRGFLRASMALVVVQLVFLASPAFFAKLIDQLQHLNEPGIIGTVSVLAGCVIVSELAGTALQRFVQEPLFLRSAWTLENSLPVRAHEKLLSLQMGYHESENTGKKISSVQKGVERLMTIVCDVFWGVLPEAVAIVFRTALLVWFDWRLALLSLIPLVPATYVYARQYMRFAPAWEEYEGLKDASVGYFCQSLICIDIVQRFVQERRESERFSAIRHRMRDLDIITSIESQRYAFATEAILRSGFCATIALGVWLVYAGWGSPGTVAFAFMAGNATIRSFTNLIQLYSRIMRNLFATERMQTLLDEPLDVLDAPDARTPDVRGGTLSFEHVTHAYPGKPGATVEDLSIEIPQGQMVAFVGKSGAGKSTVARLVSRVLDPAKGSVRLEGTDVRTLNRDWYRSLFAVVPQDVQILEGTVEENICYGAPGASSEDIERALKAAYLDDTFADRDRFPDGIRTLVGERGVRLSGGERQRVGIARAYVALLHGATTLILDEATASLDSHSERVVQQFIDTLRTERSITIIAIAHRLSTIMRADRIIVLDKGTIVESGSHERLLEKNGLYAQLVRLQQVGAIDRDAA